MSVVVKQRQKQITAMDRHVDEDANSPKVSLCPPPDTLKKSTFTDFNASSDSFFIWDGGTNSSESPDKHVT